MLSCCLIHGGCGCGCVWHPIHTRVQIRGPPRCCDHYVLFARYHFEVCDRQDFQTTVVVKFGGKPFKYAGDSGGNTVAFKTVGPRVTSVPGSVKAKAGKTKGKFTFTFAVVDGDTDAKDLKVTVKSSLGNQKALPDSAIKVSRSDFAFTVVVQPDVRVCPFSLLEQRLLYSTCL